MSFKHGHRIDLMDQGEWNKESGICFNHRESLPLSAQRRLIDMAARELRDGNIHVFDIGKKVEHIRVDSIDQDNWSLKDTHWDPFISMLVDAFKNHKPIAITPDLIYGYIAKGFALHIEKYSEKLRHLYVSHKGKKELIYENNGFINGSADNRWDVMFKYFADSLKIDVKKEGTAIIQNDIHFTTSTMVSVAHRNVLAMEAMKNYYTYTTTTLCGVASIILLGESNDWEMLYTVVEKQFEQLFNYCQKTKAFDAGLMWWQASLMPVLKNLVEIHQKCTFSSPSSLKEEARTWLRGIVKYNAGYGSGGTCTVSGWINALFPYIKKQERNPWFLNGRTEMDPNDYPCYYASVPFKWMYYGEANNMRALVGHMLLGHLDKEDNKNASVLPRGTLTLIPAWVIVHLGREEIDMDCS